jgi:hypothetical protein
MGAAGSGVRMCSPDQLHQRDRRLAHLLHRDAARVVQVLVRATLRDLGGAAINTSCNPQ